MMEAMHPSEAIDDRWRREADRLHRRYLVEIVERCGLCPWAERARVQRRTQSAVLLQSDDGGLAPALGLLDEWAAESRIDIGFILFPRLRLRRVDFDGFVARLRGMEAGRRPPGEPPFALAAFHPDAEADMEDADRLVPFLRRSPDPCIQAIRMSTLKRMRSRTPEGTQFVDLSRLEAVLADDGGLPLRQRIARANQETLRRMGVERFAARVADIHRDRDETYASLAPVTETVRT
jgi:hypothetical protein